MNSDHLQNDWFYADYFEWTILGDGHRILDWNLHVKAMQTSRLIKTCSSHVPIYYLVEMKREYPSKLEF